MKKATMILLLMVGILAFGSECEAKKISKRKHKTTQTSKQKSLGTVIGSYTLTGPCWPDNVMRLYSKGDVKSTDGSLWGNYKNLGDGVYKTFYYSMDSGDGIGEIIKENTVYVVYCGSDPGFSDFRYNKEDDTVTLLDDAGNPIADYLGYNYPYHTLPLSYFDKAGTVKWSK